MIAESRDVHVHANCARARASASKHLEGLSIDFGFCALAVICWMLNVILRSELIYCHSCIKPPPLKGGGFIFAGAVIRRLVFEVLA